MKDYQEKRAARIERMEARADRLAAEAQSKYLKGRAMFAAIPFGQPIITGRGSQTTRDVSYRSRAASQYDQAMRLNEAAQAASARATSAENNTAISSDDPDALALLRAKLAQQEAAHALLKSRRAEWIRGGRVGEEPVRAYEMSNSNGRMRATRERIATLEAMASQPQVATETVAYGVRVIEDVPENRLRLVFPGKPSPEVIASLKSRGFRWSPTAGAWQRMGVHNGSRWSAQCVLEQYAKATIS